MKMTYMRVRREGQNGISQNETKCREERRAEKKSQPQKSNRDGATSRVWHNIKCQACDAIKAENIWTIPWQIRRKDGKKIRHVWSKPNLLTCKHDGTSASLYKSETKKRVSTLYDLLSSHPKDAPRSWKMGRKQGIIPTFFDADVLVKMNWCIIWKQVYDEGMYRGSE